MQKGAKVKFDFSFAEAKYRFVEAPPPGNTVSLYGVWLESRILLRCLLYWMRKYISLLLAFTVYAFYYSGDPS